MLVGAAYQQGPREGMAIPEYLLHKWQRRCAYCQQRSRRLEVEHLVPRSRGGSDRNSNLVPGCHSCNQAKGDQTAEEFGHGHLMAQAKAPLKDAAAVNAIRWALYGRLRGLGLPLETGTGGLTKWNRVLRGISKTHRLDAVCAGSSTPARLWWQDVVPLHVAAMVRHSRQMCRTNDAGFPDKAPKATSVAGDLRTGDMVRAVVPVPSTNAGTYVGRLAIRATGSCNLKTAHGTIQGIHLRFCRPLHRGDGYTYAHGRRAVLPPGAEATGLPHRNYR
jgi:hypothetical protein